MASSTVKARIGFAIALIGMSALIASAGIVFNGQMSADVRTSTRVEAVDRSATGMDPASIDWERWRTINPRIIGWITVPGTQVDHPIVQAPTDDTTFYLDHDVFGAWNPYGCPYLDAGCAAQGWDSPNCVIFGHNMGWDQTMFADLARYASADFAAAHPTVILQTPNGAKELTVQAATVVSEDDASKRLSFLDRADFLSWWQATFESAAVPCVAHPAQSGTLITLCTCSYHQGSNERTLVYAMG